MNYSSTVFFDKKAIQQIKTCNNKNEVEIKPISFNCLFKGHLKEAKNNRCNDYGANNAPKTHSFWIHFSFLLIFFFAITANVITNKTFIFTCFRTNCIALVIGTRRAYRLIILKQQLRFFTTLFTIHVLPLLHIHFLEQIIYRWIKILWPPHSHFLSPICTFLSCFLTRWLYYKTFLTICQYF